MKITYLSGINFCDALFCDSVLNHRNEYHINSNSSTIYVIALARSWRLGDRDSMNALDIRIIAFFIDHLNLYPYTKIPQFWLRYLRLHYLLLLKKPFCSSTVGHIYLSVQTSTTVILHILKKHPFIKHPFIKLSIGVFDRKLWNSLIIPVK